MPVLAWTCKTDFSGFTEAKRLFPAQRRQIKPIFSALASAGKIDLSGFTGRKTDLSGFTGRKTDLAYFPAFIERKPILGFSRKRKRLFPAWGPEGERTAWNKARSTDHVDEAFVGSGEEQEDDDEGDQR